MDDGSGNVREGCFPFLGAQPGSHTRNWTLTTRTGSPGLPQAYVSVTRQEVTGPAAHEERSTPPLQVPGPMAASSPAGESAPPGDASQPLHRSNSVPPLPGERADVPEGRASAPRWDGPARLP
jgi:hypothetical protein